MAYRSSVQTSTSRTPNSMVFGQEITLPLQVMKPKAEKDTPESGSSEEYVHQLKNKLEQIYEIARKALNQAAVIKREGLI